MRSRHADDRVWELKGSAAGVEEVRSRLLQEAFAAQSPIVVAYDEGAPEQPELAAHVSSAGRALFTVLGQPPVGAMRDWLHYGNWQLLSPHCPQSLQDLARATPENVARFVDENHLEFVIDSFHDDVLWVVGLAR